MNDLIQIIKILNQDEVDKLNSHIDTLMFNQNSVFGEKGDGTNVDVSIRTSTGTSLNDNDEITFALHKNINKGLDEYKKRLVEINSTFNYYPVPGGSGTRSWREGIQILQYGKTQEYKCLSLIHI